MNINAGFLDLLKLPVLWSLRLYFQYFPIRSGKDFVWQRLPGRYGRFLLNTSLPARLKTGAAIHGTLLDVIHRHVFFFGVWERDVTAFYRKTLRTGDVVIDIGAHVGTHALLASHLVGPSGKVHAIEASPVTFARLKRHLEINRASNVTSYNAAVMDRIERVPMYAHQSSTGRSTAIKVDDPSFVQEDIVDGRPLAEIVALDIIRKARLIKIDVEGAEWFVIKGMLDVLSQLRTDITIIVEVTSITLSDMAISPAEFLDTFEKHGFVPWLLANDYYPLSREGELQPMLWKGCPECQIVFQRPPASD